tara:strand:+ start:1364 stop:2533 length:1170 start_codon:yes stop_codon:yes gene_type:complete
LKKENIYRLEELEKKNYIEIGRGKVISRRDLNNTKGNYPVYSSSKIGEGVFGTYGKYAFDEELITWSVDGGGKLFYRPKHKFSITNVGGFIRVKNENKINCRYLYHVLTVLHSTINFDWVKKAHPSVLRKEYNNIYLPNINEQQKIVIEIDSFLKKRSEALNIVKKRSESLQILKKNIYQEILNKQKIKGKDYQLHKLVTDDCTLSYGIVQPGLEIENGTPIVRPVDMHKKDININKLKKIKSSIANKSKKTELFGNEILLSVRGSTGDISFSNPNLKGANVSRGVIPIRFNTKIILKDFAYYQMMDNNLQKQIFENTYGTALQQINVRDVKKLVFKIIPLPNQKNICEILKKIELKVSYIEECLSKLSENLDKIKILLISKKVNFLKL